MFIRELYLVGVHIHCFRPEHPAQIIDVKAVSRD